ncbi:branched-chain amino acid ABC transporter permease [Caballeronia insecticola]|nr:branched-chain amino acid ABC transporter permease [Caballeronia insecticola]
MPGSRVTLVGFGTILLIALPMLLPASLLNASIAMLIAVLFACAFNLLAGQAGLLSFGHAAYLGIGAFATVQAMNALGGSGLLPTPLLPLIGAAAGLVSGSVVGWFATRRTGVYFAMVTLALAELLHSLAPHLKGYFGGEAGLSTMRNPAWGFTFADSVQVYYLTLAWVLVSMALLYFFTLTPTGRLALGLRENAHRLRFLGYDTHRLSVLVFAVSTMFSGIAGALQAINMEGANYVVFEGSVSAAVVLNTYIGGATTFLGPALGAAVMTFFGYAVSDLTRSWLLYQGLLFAAVMLFMPSGLSGLVGAVSSNLRTHGLRSMLPTMVLYATAGMAITAGTVFLIELAQRLFAQDYRALAVPGNAGGLPLVSLFGAEWVPASALTWLVPAALIAIGAGSARAASRAWARIKDRTSRPGPNATADAIRAEETPT